jgi:hypothetical protein
MPANQERGYLVVEQTEYRIVTVAAVKPKPVTPPSSDDPVEHLGVVLFLLLVRGLAVLLLDQIPIF